MTASRVRRIAATGVLALAFGGAACGKSASTSTAPTTVSQSERDLWRTNLAGNVNAEIIALNSDMGRNDDSSLTVADVYAVANKLGLDIRDHPNDMDLIRRIAQYVVSGGTY